MSKISQMSKIDVIMSIKKDIKFSINYTIGDQ